MTDTWIYIDNPFIDITKDNYKKALKLSNYHHARLLKATIEAPADADFMLMYGRYLPLHVAYDDVYTKWKSAGGIQQGQTLNLYQLLKLLVTKAQRWEVAVMVVYPLGSTEHEALFPFGRTPFSSGSIATRINAVKTLGETIGADPALAALKVEVDAYHTQLKDARTAQEGAKGAAQGRSALVDIEREKIMICQWQNLGLFNNKFPEHPDLIATFFEISILRDISQTFFTGTLDPAETEAILIHTFVADDEMKLKVAGQGPVSFYLATTAGGTNSTAVAVNTDEEPTIQAAAFGITDYGTHRYLTAVNQSGVETHYEVTLI